MSRYFVILLFVISHSAAWGHPISHTDAWVTVSDVVDVRLKVLLDDVVRHQLQVEETDTKIPVADFEGAILKHAATLLTQLRVFQHGVPLAGRVTTLPTWDSETPTVDLTADASLRLTWNLQFEPVQAEVKSLCFMHQFTHDALTKPGELRLNLRHEGSGRRVSAAIPPGRPYTVLMPDESAAGRIGDANSIVSRLVKSPAAIIHEFTAPLLLIDAAWPPAFAKRQSLREADANVAVLLGSSDVDMAKGEMANWFAANVTVQSDSRDLQPIHVEVELFTDDLENGSQVPPPATSESGIPLVGTTVGVRMTYSRHRSGESLGISFAARPGPFDALTVETIDSSGQTSQQVAFNEDVSMSRTHDALRFQWPTSDVSVSSPPSGFAVPNPDIFMARLVTAQQVRPGRLAMGTMALIVFGLVFTVLRARTYRSTSLRRELSSCLLILLPVYWLLPDTRLSVDSTSANSVVESLLCGTYRATGQIGLRARVSEITQYLEEDLAESVYLSLTGAMLSAETGEVFIDLETVSVDALTIDSPESLDRLNVECTWRVRGTVYHWGHAHVRELVSTGQIGLVQHENRWRIGAISLTEAGRISRPETNGRSS